LIAGASPPSRLIGSDCHGACLYQMRDWANKLIEEAARPFALSADAVVFLMHQGYQFFFFQADGKSDDPEVFYFIEGAPAETLPVSKFERFSGWVEAIA